MEKPTIYFASDHAGFALKATLVAFVRDVLGYTVVDCGASTYEQNDDYPDFIARAAAYISREPTSRAIILGGSGQGEAMVANRYAHVRATVFYGEPAVMQMDAVGEELTIIKASRIHNDANVLSLGARFLSDDAAKVAVSEWLSTPFSGDERHVRRIKKFTNGLTS